MNLRGFPRTEGSPASPLPRSTATPVRVNSARRMMFHHPEDSPLNGLDLAAPRTHETPIPSNPCRFMPDEDRQAPLDAALQPPAPTHLRLKLYGRQEGDRPEVGV